jgi:O-antigen/teichoic acid export membrane protein
MPALRQNWKLGRWVLASQLVSDLGSNFLALWLLAFVSGEATTGVFAACVAIVGFSNPLLIGISHVLTPRTAQAFAQGGRAGLRRFVVKATLVVGTAMGLFCAVVLFGSELALRVIYGEAYAGHGGTVFALALAGLAWAVGMSPASGLLTMERPEVSFRANLCGLVATITVAACLIGCWHILGVALGILAGRVVSATMRWTVFWRLANQ